MEDATSGWANRRKNIYLGVTALILALVSIFIFWKFWQSNPSCFDGIKNGDEQGVDCGGSCRLICPASVLAPIVRWDPRFFEISPNIWSVVVYVENPNISAYAKYLPYTFNFYDDNNNLILSRKGATVLPKNKTVGVFEGSLVSSVKIKRATFQIDDGVIWEKGPVSDPDLLVNHGPLLQLESTPKIEADVVNKSDQEVKNIELVVAVFDGEDNTIATSRTFIEKLKKGEDQKVFFTWPKPFDLGSKVCEKPSEIVLLLDRSGSMSAIGQNPPQPLTDAKEAAGSFVDQLNSKDKVAVVSFATKVNDPVDLSLTNDFVLAKQSILGVSIEKGSVQYTNIYDPLHAAWQQLVNASDVTKTSKVVVLLTDGVANRPASPGSKNEADDIRYAEGLALNESLVMKQEGINIFTIGLGKNINEAFLRNVASINSYFHAPSAADLESIYKNISSEICKEMPARIEITYKVFGDSI